MDGSELDLTEERSRVSGQGRWGVESFERREKRNERVK